MKHHMLDQVTWPEDLKRLDREDLPELAQDIRDYIMEVVKTTGGHLGSGMGVVELTIALHYLYNFREDRLVFDVGHQCYPHKILTGRKDEMFSLRQKGGLSGFTNRFESPYDVYSCGHAGTAISCALGIAHADRRIGRARECVAIVGDAAMGCGVAFEAMNHGGALGEKVTIVLNDNNWSITKTVGALSSYLNKIRTGSLYKQAKKTVHQLLQAMPVVGEKVDKSLEDGLKVLQNTLAPGAIFEALDLDYYGPIDGHDIDELLTTFEHVRSKNGISLVHVRTQKGKGVPGSQEKYDRAHAAKPQAPKKEPSAPKSAASEPIVLVPQQPRTVEKAWTHWFSDALIEACERDETVLALTAAMPDGTGLMKLMETLPDRGIDGGIAEQHLVAFASGLATAGLKPVVAVYSTFLQRAYDQVFQEVLLNEVPVVFVMDRAGLVGEDGSSHAGIFDIAYLGTIPNIILMAPRDGVELGMMLDYALEIRKPVGIRIARGGTVAGVARTERPALELGKAERLREGRDLAIVAYGSEVAFAETAAGILSAEGIEVEVWNARFAKPIDEEMVRDIRSRHDLVLTVEDHSLKGGFGSLFLGALHGLPAGRLPRTKCLGVPDHFHKQATRSQLLNQFGLDAEGIAASAREEVGLLRRGPGPYVVDAKAEGSA